MDANESARQAGSNDTIPDPWLTTDGFAVGMLAYGISYIDLKVVQPKK